MSINEEDLKTNGTEQTTNNDDLVKSTDDATEKSNAINESATEEQSEVFECGNHSEASDLMYMLGDYRYAKLEQNPEDFDEPEERFNGFNGVNPADIFLNNFPTDHEPQSMVSLPLGKFKLNPDVASAIAKRNMVGEPAKPKLNPLCYDPKAINNLHSSLDNLGVSNLNNLPIGNGEGVLNSTTGMGGIYTDDDEGEDSNNYYMSSSLEECSLVGRNEHYTNPLRDDETVRMAACFKATNACPIVGINKNVASAFGQNTISHNVSINSIYKDLATTMLNVPRKCGEHVVIRNLIDDRTYNFNDSNIKTVTIDAEDVNDFRLSPHSFTLLQNTQRYHKQQHFQLKFSLRMHIIDDLLNDTRNRNLRVLNDKIKDKEFEQIDMLAVDLQHVVSARQTFQCYSCKKYELTNCDELFDASRMFFGNPYLEEIYIDMPSLRLAPEMFCNCPNLKRVTFSPRTTNIVNADSMFYKCPKLEEVTGHFPALVNSSQMFSRTPALKVIPSIEYANIVDTRDMFKDSAVSAPPEYVERDATIMSDEPGVVIFNSHIDACRYLQYHEGDFSQVKTLIINCDTGLSTKDCSDEYRAEQFMCLNDKPPVYRSLSSFFSTEVKNLNCDIIVGERVTSLRDLFAELTDLQNIKSITLAKNVIDISGMFAHCTNLKNVPIFDTSSVVNFSHFITDSENEIDVNAFNYSSAMYMLYSFAGAVINSTEITAPQVKYADGIFARSVFTHSEPFKCNLPQAVFLNDAFKKATLNNFPDISLEQAEYLHSTFSHVHGLCTCPDLNLPNAKILDRMFLEVRSLRYVGLIKAPKAQSVDLMFADCAMIKQFPKPEMPEDLPSMRSLCLRAYLSPWFCEIYSKALCAVENEKEQGVHDYGSADPEMVTDGTELMPIDLYKRLLFSELQTLVFYAIPMDFQHVHFTGYHAKASTFSRRLIRLMDCKIILASSLENVAGMFMGLPMLRYVRSIDCQSYIPHAMCLFRGDQSLYQIDDLSFTKKCNNLDGLFLDCPSLQNLPTIDMSMVQYAAGMFEGCTALENVSFTDTSNLVDASDMFAHCHNLKTIENFNPVNIRILDRTFKECRSLDVPELNLVHVTDTVDAFVGCHSHPDIPVMNSDIYLEDNETNKDILVLNHPSEVTMQVREDLMNDRYKELIINYNTTYASPIAVDEHYNLLKISPIHHKTKFVHYKITLGKRVTSVAGLFAGCLALQKAPYFDTSNVTDMNFMFLGCMSLNTIPDYDTSKVLGMYSFLCAAERLDRLPKLNTSSLQIANSMFLGTSISKVPALDFSNVKFLDWTFACCTSITKCAPLDTQQTESMIGTFISDARMETFPVMNFAKVQDMSASFMFCRSLKSIPALEMPQLKFMRGSFSYCLSLSSYGNLVMPQIQNVDSCFLGCAKLTKTPKIEDITTETIGFDNMFLDSSVVPVWCRALCGLLDPEELVNVQDEEEKKAKTTETKGKKETAETKEEKATTKRTTAKKERKKAEPVTKDSAILSNEELVRTNLRDYFAKDNIQFAELPDSQNLFQNIPEDSAFAKILKISRQFPVVKTKAHPGTVVLNSYHDVTSEVLEQIRTNKIEHLIINYNVVAMPQQNGMIIANTPFPRDLTEITFKITASPYITRLSGLFCNCSKLQKITGKIDLGNVTDISYMFAKCEALEEIPALKTAKVQNFKRVAIGCTVFKSAPIFDYSNAENVQEAFSACPIATDMPPLPLLMHNISADMFAGNEPQWFTELLATYEARKNPELYDNSLNENLESRRIVLNSPNDITSFVARRILANDLDELVINYNLEISNGIDLFDYYFAKSLYPEQIKTPFTSRQRSINFKITIGNNVCSIAGLFARCYQLKKIPSFNTAHVKNMSLLFAGCESLEYAPQLDTSSCRCMRGMFVGCRNLRFVPPLDTSDATDLAFMFYDCHNLQSLPKLNLISVTDMRNFAQHTGLSGDMPPKTTISYDIYD